MCRCGVVLLLSQAGGEEGEGQAGKKSMPEERGALLEFGKGSVRKLNRTLVIECSARL